MAFRRLIILAAVAAALAACGKRGELEHREDAKPVYPKTYPTR